jgi:hypothetical protein
MENDTKLKRRVDSNQQATPDTEEDLHKVRDKVVEDYYDRGRQPSFMVCRRLHDPGNKAKLEYDKEGNCSMCKVEILYDARFDKVIHRICLPCAVKCAKDGMTELANMGGWEPDKSEATDAEMHARLVTTYNNNIDGAIPL